MKKKKNINEQIIFIYIKMLCCLSPNSQVRDEEDIQ